MSDPTTSAAPGWYPDASGNQRWWDGRGWTEHVAPAAPALGAYERPRLPEGTRVDTAWIWVVATATFIAVIPIFFLDFAGYMRETMTLGAGGGTTIGPAIANFFIIYALTFVLGLTAWALAIVSAFRDYKHLISVGAVRPFHWAFAFIPYALVYLIGRHVVLRKMVRTSGAPLWVHIGLLVLFVVAYTIWTFVVTAQMVSELSSLYPYGTYS